MRQGAQIECGCRLAWRACQQGIEQCRKLANRIPFRTVRTQIGSGRIGQHRGTWCIGNLHTGGSHSNGVGCDDDAAGSIRNDLAQHVGAFSDNRPDGAVAERLVGIHHVVSQALAAVHRHDNEKYVGFHTVFQYGNHTIRASGGDATSELIDCGESAAIGNDEQLAILCQHTVVGFPCLNARLLTQRRYQGVSVENRVSELRFHSAFGSV